MKILVLGGTRFMGRLTVQLLLDRGDAVTVISRGNTRPDWWTQVDTRTADRHDAASMATALGDDRWDAVLDTQAYCRDDVANISKLLNGRIGHYIFVSTGSVYHDGQFDFLKNCPFSEDAVDWSTIDYQFAGEHPEYGLGKRQAEKFLMEESSLPFTILRIPAIQGEDDPSTRIWWWLQRAFDHQPILMPHELSCPFRLLYSNDAARAFVQVIDHPACTIGKTYNIASQDIIVPRRWTNALAEATGTTINTAPIPLDAVRNSPGLRNYAPPYLRDTPYVHDISKAINDFGFSTTPLEEWLKATSLWYQNNRPAKDSAGYDQRQQEMDLAAKWQARMKDWTAANN